MLGDKRNRLGRLRSIDEQSVPINRPDNCTTLHTSSQSHGLEGDKIDFLSFVPS